MKLGTILAFCTGAAVVFVGQRYVGTPDNLSRPKASRTRSQQTCEALALLKTEPIKQTGRPTALTEVQPDNDVAASQAPTVTDTTPPVDTSPLHEPGTGDAAQTPPQQVSNDSAPQALATPEAASEPTLVAELPGLTLPPVAPKISSEANLRVDEPRAVAVPAEDGEHLSGSSTLETLVNKVRSVGDRLGTVLSQPAHLDRPSMTFTDLQPALVKPDLVKRDVLAPNPLGAPRQPEGGQFVFTPPVARDAGVPRTADNGTASTARPSAGKPSQPNAALAEVSPAELEALKVKVRRVLDHHRDRMLNTRDHGAWEIMHSLIAYGVPKEVQVGGPGGRRVNAIGWLCFNGPSAGERLFTVGSVGPRGRLGPGLQGHEGQFLAMLAQSRVEPNYPMKVDGRDYTINELVRQEQATCRANSELTFKLIGLMHYLKSDEKWRDDAGGEWDIPRLIKEELAQPIIGATCGGTHRLFGLTYAYKKRAQRGEPVTGQYRRAQIYVQDFQEYTFKMQNPDGSFSTAFFAGRGASPDLQRRLETTGHIAEWLTFSLDDNQLRQRRMVKAIDYLATLLDENPEMNWKVGPTGHALHALNMYDSFVFGGQSYPRSPAVASGVGVRP